MSFEEHRPWHSDIATVGTALEVADGYKIQFNFYTTVALVMLFDFIMLGLRDKM